LIAIDTSSLSEYLSGGAGQDVELVDAALADHHAVLPPVVLSELLGAPGLSRELIQILLQIPLVPITDGYWERAGRLRGSLRARGLKARLADALIAQSCLDHGLVLITRDADFRHFRRVGLKIAG
jgi:predicted nucleic acid-binding protein